jgi:crossover junction endodeoxyribonuclease RusA
MMVLPWPPSVNHYWRNVGGKMLISKKGREYREAVRFLAIAENWPIHGSKRLTVNIEAWIPDNRRRDLDNMLKAALDALTYAGVWEDDSQIDDLRIVRKQIGGMLKVGVTTE